MQKVQVDIEVGKDFKDCECKIKNKHKDNYEVVNVEYKRKWDLKSFGRKYCEVYYLGNVKSIESEPKLPLFDDTLYNKFENFDAKMDNVIREIKSITMKAEENADIYSSIRKILIKNGVEEQVAQSLVKKVISSIPKEQKNSEKAVLIKLFDVLRDTVRTNGGFNFDKGRITMFVGPTGVGKTTTLAKIAGMLYQQNKKIGIITLDTYRLGAAAQLKEYADIMDVPIKVCSNVDELQNSLFDFMDKDCILIDTTGRSQKKIEIEDDLKEMINMVDPNELTLVLSATTKTEDMYDCLEQFGKLDVNSLIFTKLDETNSFGSIVNASYKCPKLKISYFTTGQSVPDDIEAAKAEKIVKNVVNKEKAEERI